VTSPHGIPLDLLDRVIIIKTVPYGLEEIMHILSIRAAIEGINIEDAALQALGEIGARTSLRLIENTYDITLTIAINRYGAQLLTPANVISRVRGRSSITKEDITEATGLFLDAKASAKVLKDNEAKYLK
jgi:RuvB-like protein 1 (pontin 52)